MKSARFRQEDDFLEDLQLGNPQQVFFVTWAKRTSSFSHFKQRFLIFEFEFTGCSIPSASYSLATRQVNQ